VCGLWLAPIWRDGALQPSSPYLNPIEEVFANLNQLMRDVSAQTVEDTWRREGLLHDRFPAAECAIYFINTGYVSS
jgi:transposase